MITATFIFLIAAAGFFFGAFFNKLINDNLPDLRRKKLTKGYKKYVRPYLLIALLYVTYFFIKLRCDKELEKNYIYTLLAAVIVFIAFRVINKQIKKERKLFRIHGYE